MGLSPIIGNRGSFWGVRRFSDILFIFSGDTKFYNDGGEYEGECNDLG